MFVVKFSCFDQGFSGLFLLELASTYYYFNSYTGMCFQSLFLGYSGNLEKSYLFTFFYEFLLTK